MTVNPEAMSAQAGKASALLGAMSNQTRLMILCHLIAGERSVTELAELLGTRQSTISQHLALLKEDALVQARRDGQSQFYSLTGDEARSILEVLHELYCVPASRKK